MAVNLLNAMNNSFIDRVHHLVMSNITDEKFGVANLASLISLSTSQTLRKVKAATGKSVNQYIREIRLTKAAKLIKKTDFTAAEIAYQVGFSSPSYFNKTFHKYYGLTPGEFKTQSKSLGELALAKNKIKTLNRVSYKKAILITTITMFAIVGYLLINNAASHVKSGPFSIAILPFKDLSSEGNTQWFGEGVAEDIRIKLSKIEGLRVISRTSTERYKNSDKLLPEIAADLNVTYLLEGSTRKQDSTILITAQLMDATDNHIWAENYSGTLDDIFKIQSDMAIKIVQQLKITISPEVEKAIKKHATVNTQAYELFIKGRFIANSRVKEDIELSIKYYQKAIDLDPNYADAYAEIANSYSLLVSYEFIQYNEVNDNINKLINKALEIDSNTVRVYTVKAILDRNNYDWDSAEKNYKKAIAINPNDETTRHEYASYLILKPNPDLKNSLLQRKIAQQINPLSNPTNANLIYELLDNDKIKEGEDHYNKWGFLISRKEAKIKIESRILAFKHKDWTNALIYYEKAFQKEPQNLRYIQQLIYLYNSVTVDRKKALKFAKLAYDIDSLNIIITNKLIWNLGLNNKHEAAMKILNRVNIDEDTRNLYTWMLEMWRDKSDKIMDYHYKLKNPENKILSFAKLGDIKSINELRAKHPIGSWTMAQVHAYLKERDSMYYYMNKIVRKINALNLNNKREFDPYRKEARYKAFLKKNYLPLTQWNE